MSKGGVSLDVFARELTVMECLIAGTSFRQLDKIEKDLKETVRLEIKREGHNSLRPFCRCSMVQEYKNWLHPKTKE